MLSLLVCDGFPVHAVIDDDDDDDDKWLHHAKRNSRTHVYAGRKVHCLTGMLSVFDVFSLQLYLSVLITVQYFCHSSAQLEALGCQIELIAWPTGWMIAW